jgi:hypothetical protein
MKKLVQSKSNNHLQAIALTRTFDNLYKFANNNAMSNLMFEYPLMIKDETDKKTNKNRAILIVFKNERILIINIYHVKLVYLT